METKENKLSKIKKKLNDLNQSKIFIGRDYLLWLWYMAENHKKFSCMQTKETPGITVDIWVDNKIIFNDFSGQGHENHLKGGTPSSSIESTVALQNGKALKELRLGLSIDGVGEYTFTLQTSDLNPRSVHLPIQKSNALEEYEGDIIELRLYQVEIMQEVLDDLFRQFLLERMTSKWKKQCKIIKEWIETRHQSEKYTIQ